MNIAQTFTRIILSFLLLTATALSLHAQDERVLGRINNSNKTAPTQLDRNGKPILNNNGNDSLKHRDNTTDSITIYFRYFDSTRIRYFDSSVSNFYTKFPVPAQYISLSNFGSAARSLIFQPNLKAGWDAGFHAYDIYRLNIEDTRFYQTTRPYTEMGYQLGSKGEQMINILHTQNIKPNFNMAFQYRFINSPGSFKNQNASHNNFRINGVYQSNNKRYTAYGILIKNKLRASENGGIQNDSALSKTGLNDPFDIATRLGGQGNSSRNFFNTSVATGNLYDESIFLLRQQYDLGQKDSLAINDSTVIKLFYPRIRLQHTFKYSKQGFQFQDLFPDSTNYHKYFNYFIHPSDTILYKDSWKEVVNDFSIISFPEKKNLNQYLKVGVALQNLNGGFKNANKNYYNIFLNGEYRNRTRNQKWDVEAKGQLYLAGLDNGDYAMQVSLKRLLSTKLGSLEAGFQNVNRTPSFLFSGQSSYPIKLSGSFNKENTTRIYARLDDAAKNISLFAEYYVVSNYTYFDSFFRAAQEGTLFNVLHASAEKKFVLSRKFNLYTEVHLQQTAGNPPVNVPLLFALSRIAHETHPYQNLVLSYGFEFRYHTPYKADNYSPFTGQFFYQDNYTVSNRPDVNLFFNFRIKSFKAFLRLENLNTLQSNNGLAFTKHNFTAQTYPYPALWFRASIFWTFVN